MGDPLLVTNYYSYPLLVTNYYYMLQQLVASLFFLINPIIYLTFALSLI